VSIAADHACGAGDLRGRGVGPQLQRSGLQAQQRQAMGEHVVHFPRDPVALHLPGLGDAELLFGRRPFALDEGELTPRPDEHSQRQHRHDTDDAEHALPPIRRRHVGPDQQG
jgi:hypothetical protein